MDPRIIRQHIQWHGIPEFRRTHPVLNEAEEAVIAEIIEEWETAHRDFTRLRAEEQTAHRNGRLFIIKENTPLTYIQFLMGLQHTIETGNGIDDTYTISAPIDETVPRQTYLSVRTFLIEGRVAFVIAGRGCVCHPTFNESALRDPGPDPRISGIFNAVNAAAAPPPPPRLPPLGLRRQNACIPDTALFGQATLPEIIDTINLYFGENPLYTKNLNLLELTIQKQQERRAIEEGLNARLPINTAPGTGPANLIYQGLGLRPRLDIIAPRLPPNYVPGPQQWPRTFLNSNNAKMGLPWKKGANGHWRANGAAVPAATVPVNVDALDGGTRKNRNRNRNRTKHRSRKN